VIGGDLALGGRIVLGERFELGVRLRAVDYTLVQTAVNKVTEARFGPLALGGAAAIDQDLTLFALVEVPFTRDEMDTLHASGQLGLAFTTALSADWFVHARFGGVFAYASSAAGDTVRGALRAGTDLVWHPRHRFALHAGADVEAGWRDGLGFVLARIGVAIRIGASHRFVFGAGAPLGGDEPTTAIATFGVSRDL
jgi:hypothetical protein